MRFLVFFLFFASQNLTAQVSDEMLLGLWGVTEVKVGERTMTPIAKWTEFTADHRHRDGNGWTQHTVGNWKLDAENALLEIGNDNGVADEYGAFRIKFSEVKMYWQREEEGMAVQVTWERIENLPQAHWDKALGLWELENSESANERDDWPKDVKVTLHMRWDRMYVIEITPGGYGFHGFWVPNPHKSRIEIFNEEENPFVRDWQLSFENDQMIWKSIGQEKIRLTFRRIHDFPGG